MSKTLIITTAALAAALAFAAPYAGYEDDETPTFGYTNNTHDAGLYLLKLKSHLEFDEPCPYPGPAGADTMCETQFWTGTNAWSTPRVSGNDPSATQNEWKTLQGILWSDGPNWNDRPPYVVKRGDLDSYERCDDSGIATPIGLTVEHHGMQWSDGPNDDYVIVRYDVKNTSGRNLTDLHLGWFADLDIGGGMSYIDDVVGYNPPRQVVYMNDADPGHPYVGIRILDGTPVTGTYWDIMEDPANDADAWKRMTCGIWEGINTPYDYRIILTSGPHNLPVNDNKHVALAIAAGANLNAMLANSDAAYNKYWGIYTGVDYFYARARADEVELNWQPNAPYVGFNLFRAADDNAKAAKVNDALITGRSPFRFLDAAVDEGVKYAYRLEGVDANGRGTNLGTAEVTTTAVTARGFALAPCRPNPARGATTMAFTLPATGPIKLELFDVAGRKVATLAEGVFQGGTNEVMFNAGDMAAGVYIYRLTAGVNAAAKRLVITH